MKPIFYIFLFVQFTLTAQINIDAVLIDYKKDVDLTHASYGFCVIDLKTKKIIKEYNSDLSLIPASTLKIVTTGAALGILKKDFTYKTNYSLIYKGDSINSSDKIGLKISGVGDPSFNSSYFYSNDSLFFSGIIKKIKSSGVKKINSVIIDNSYFDNNIPSTWIWGDIGNYFGAGANGLSYKDNKFSIFYTSSATNTKAKIEGIKPDYFSKKINLKSDVLSYGTEDEAYVYGNPYDYTRTVSGTIPPNKTNYEVEAQMPSPEEFFKYELTTNLQNNNLFQLKESAEAIDNSEDKAIKSKWIYTYSSPKLEKIIFYTNTKSNNHYAESLLKTVGAIKTGKQGTTQNGIGAIKKYWETRGIDVSGLHMADGSGLSRANTITTKIQAEILTIIYNDSLMYEPFNNSLPIAGKNGSMTNLCKGTFAENNMRAKTGYINRARGYCGYVKTKSGKNLAFSVLFNNFDCSPKEMKLKIEKLLVSLVEL